MLVHHTLDIRADEQIEVAVAMAMLAAVTVSVLICRSPSDRAAGGRAACASTATPCQPFCTRSPTTQLSDAVDAMHAVSTYADTGGQVWGDLGIIAAFIRHRDGSSDHSPSAGSILNVTR